jgi:hypothetical protein
MSQPSDKALAIRLDDGRVVIATPKPEDQERLGRLDQEIVFLTPSGDYDTSGHGVSNEIVLDVEGHAITLRLPTSADAEAVRKALVVGAVSATIVAAGAIAAMQGSQATPAAPDVVAPPAAIERPAPAPQPNAEFLERRDRAMDPLLTVQVPLSDSQAGSSSGTAPADGPSQGTHGEGRGELE